MIFSVHDLASGRLGRIEASFMSLDRQVGLGADRIESSFAQLGLGLGLMTAGLGLVAGGFALATKAGEFERAIAEAGAVANASAEQLGLFREAALQAGISTQFSPAQATQGLQSLASA